ncbi:hypothetical protein [Legionella bononiensis]|uniref:TauD/TfdA-like domain-containing protein n=1 Tax=Legionella bononiensis TaxID=2793102 RepID=A0ABS1W9R3_9GAMM|nr:hypothetical protein [Legionella bononiensis]MBL7480716.1 hypothetical protein [Legionella bononiensis]MBL7526085.1 hypothetical protein [Legionella bononiensis]MBL7563420.1 hypothetical protein [Legionella bononiensis]
MNKLHEEMSIRIFDAKNSLTTKSLLEIKQHVLKFGYIYLTNTGLTTKEELIPLLPELGFDLQNQFNEGGRTSKKWQEQWCAPGLRRMDYYPPDRYLLPNNEIQYQRVFPKDILFFCSKPPKPDCGGRTFLHSSLKLEAYLRNSGAIGTNLLKKMELHGLMIETGYLDAHHPEKNNNYFQSWQERFGTSSREEAFRQCQSLTDQYDHCWWQKEEEPGPDGTETYTLMTRITLPAFLKDPITQEQFLRFPRIAADTPSIRNGFRRFPLGNGEELTTDEKNLLKQAYLETREGRDWQLGDIILMDNLRYGHSRESFTGDREILLGMARSCRIEQDASISYSKHSTNEAINGCNAAEYPQAKNIANIEDVYYTMPSNKKQWVEQFSMRIFDAKGKLNDRNLALIQKEFNLWGALHLINTGLKPQHGGDIPDELINALGFGPEQQFKWGGQYSGRTQLHYLSKHMRETDQYPPELFLLPHNEILYQRFMPENLLFYSVHPTPACQGGRTFVHSAKQVEQLIAQSGEDGLELLSKLKQHGLLINTGFLDENHPNKKENYFRSWQDRFGTSSREEAMKRCKESTYQFDNCAWQKEEILGIDGKPSYTLMTSIKIPAFKKNEQDGESYLLFPRIAFDLPKARNGYRTYPLGNGEELTVNEKNILLRAFWDSRQGRTQQSGDLLLVNNIQFGHARESYKGKRQISVSMAGIFWTDDV